MQEQKLHYIDLFAGCGGLSLGLFNSNFWHGILAVEKNPMAFETLQHNLIGKEKHFSWPDGITCKEHDINELLANNKDFLGSLAGTVDMVAGGPPCQGFSTAGKREESDGRNNLVHSYIEFVSIVKPKIIFFENVKGFTLEFKKNADKGKNFSHEVIKALEDLDYNVYGKMLDFSSYGIPQARKRFILVGIRNDVAKAKGIKAHNFFERLDANCEDILAKKGLKRLASIEDAIGDLTESNGTVPSPDSKGFLHGLYGKHKRNLQKLLRGGKRIGSVPDSHRFARHGDDVRVRFLHLIESRRNQADVSDDSLTKKRNQIVLDGLKPSPTLTTLPDDYIHYSEPRILTVREYARIQTFNDWYEIRGKYTTGGKLRKKEVPRYTQIGNAIPSLFAEQAGIVLYKLLND